MPGRAEPIRLAFILGGIEFSDVRISYRDFEKMKAGQVIVPSVTMAHASLS